MTRLLQAAPRLIAVHLFSAILALATVIDGRAQRIPTLYPRGEPWDIWRGGETQVAGGVVVGVMRSTSNARVGRRSLTVELPATRDSVLCLELNSRDNRYSARFEYDLPRTRERVVRLDLSSRHAERRRGYAFGELAALARTGNGCREEGGAYAVSSWNPRFSDDSVFVLVNSRLPTDVVGGTGARPELAARCTPIAAPAIAYSRRCAVPAGWLTPGREFFVRMQEIRSFRHVSLPLRLR